MKSHGHTLRSPNGAAARSARLCAAIAAFFLLGALLAASASASFEQVETFDYNKEVDIKLPLFAVNGTGAGGVPAGTVYAASGGTNFGIYRYTAKGDFVDLWRKESALGIAIDQTTGYVYTLEEGTKGSNAVKVFSADGSTLIDSFGEHVGAGEGFDESPGKIHSLPWSNGLAVNAAGTVYVTDVGKFPESRVMVFKPQSPGDYEHYGYTGRANDVESSGHRFGHLAIDDSANLYSAVDDEILEFAPGENSTPACAISTTSLFQMTVNPASGEVFYYSSDTPKVLHALSACGQTGKFVEQIPFAVTPRPGSYITALAFNPSLVWDGERPPGALYAADANEVSGGKPLGYIFASAKVFPPVIDSQSVSAVTSTTALLGAQINPKGSDTDYVFQYLTGAAYDANDPNEPFAGATETPLGGSVLGSGQSPLSASASLLGLAPDTEYRYRVIATSHCESGHPEVLCEDTGQVKSFRTFPSEAPGLPDGRAWELVSPAQKLGGEVFPLEPDRGSGFTCLGSKGCKPGFSALKYPRQSSADGDSVAYQGFPFSSTEGAPNSNEYVSRRTASGWQTTILASPLASEVGSSQDGYAAFDAELSKDIFLQGLPSLTPQAPFEYPNIYTQDTASPAAPSPLLFSQPTNRSGNNFLLEYAGAADDFSHVFFAANDALTGATLFAPEAVDYGIEIGAPGNLYESVGGQLHLVNVLPGNTQTSPAVFGGPQLPLGGLETQPDITHATSADGSRAFFSDAAGQLYQRIDGQSTVVIPDPGKYLTASDDGLQVLLSNGHLYDTQSEVITDLTEGQGGFEGIAGAAEDLSHLYFFSTAALTGEEENSEGAKAQAGKDNLYSWRGGESTFVATLNFTATGGRSDAGDALAQPLRRTAEASPDGRWLAFQSLLPLTGYDNVGPTCTTAPGVYASGSCVEAFLYDSASGELRCASCNPSGGRPLGGTRLPVVTLFAPKFLTQPRYLTNSGRLYFDTQDALSPFDTNRAVEGIGPESGTPAGASAAGAEDVYQYEPQGLGGCRRSGGCVSLISAGRESLDSNFFAADETGANVFFTTRDQLVRRDPDDLVDLYVAREGGGILSESETGPVECQGEACQSSIAPPTDPPSALQGAGNVDESKAKPCPKGKTKRKGHCVKKHRFKKHHKRHHRRTASKTGRDHR